LRIAANGSTTVRTRWCSVSASAHTAQSTFSWYRRERKNVERDRSARTTAGQIARRRVGSEGSWFNKLQTL
jgi:hypothetical protein